MKEGLLRMVVEKSCMFRFCLLWCGLLNWYLGNFFFAFTWIECSVCFLCYGALSLFVAK